MACEVFSEHRGVGGEVQHYCFAVDGVEQQRPRTLAAFLINLSRIQFQPIRGFEEHVADDAGEDYGKVEGEERADECGREIADAGQVATVDARFEASWRTMPFATSPALQATIRASTTSA